jgi:hypothetical protein
MHEVVRTEWLVHPSRNAISFFTPNVSRETNSYFPQSELEYKFHIPSAHDYTGEVDFFDITTTHTMTTSS